ncbi:similar to Saccharomyces cerevisiae YBR015C MNN2 Alpha-1,2-mannosyltransferase [Maudiozyma saulgeensis]|uniref:Similar to Saccharomyces cerevisiae YBR015C MNN2 Alpha-1,2-mannosyltransferase n=1 Tax=Maudiozyma saulgeensis TaxID=1789683 RepID=A0A1X7R4D7_9SACH|nr:similar to Saccharomyces cerevisiae YBR015C MNN2 Alpha-1,2-mannosyltransferase [Kazachstania saulgeensis]
MLSISRRVIKFIKLALVLLLIISIIIVSTGYSETANDTVAYYTNSIQEYVDTYILPEKEKIETDDEALEDIELDFENIEKGNDDEFEHDMFADQENPTENDQSKTVADFFHHMFKTIATYSPTLKNSKSYKDSCLLDRDIGTRPDNYKDWFKLTQNNLNGCLEISDEEFEHLRDKHAEFILALYGMDIQELTTAKELSEDNSINSYYKSDGIVIVGGDKYTLLAFLSIKTLREFNTTLPVEVFIPNGESYDSKFCNDLLPQYNAKCIYLSDILSQETIEQNQFFGYQYKSLAIVASSFANVLLLDADNFAITNLDDIFDSKVFKENGLVLWPDFWRRTTAPKYYDIAGVNYNPSIRVRNSVDDVSPVDMYDNKQNDLENIPFHDFEGTLPDMSTESGQLLINKHKHLKTIILSLYYNFNGPNWYYSIFSQRAAGEGDKETFIAAAHYLDLPFYQVRTGPGVDGYSKKENNNDYRGVGILQHNFIQDNARYEAAVADYKDKKFGPFTEEQVSSFTLDTFYSHYFEGDSTKEVDIMFIHANYPKFDPVALYQSKDFMYNGDHFRSYNNLKRINNFDLELCVWGTLKEFVCSNRMYFPYLNHALDDNEDEYAGMCKYIEDRANHMEATHKEALSSD